MSSSRSILTLMSKVLGPQFAGETWDAWRVLLRAMFALELTDEELEVFEELTGRSSAPTVTARDVWAIVGRRGGKSIIAAVVAVFLTTCKSYKLARGEVGTFMVIAADRRQARVVRRYISGLLHSTPVLEQLVEHETKSEIRLTNGLSIEIHTASFRSVRGYTVVGAICDEIAFWRTDDAANPDREIIAALRPAMATIPDAMLLCLSSPYARRGELYRAHRNHYGKEGDVLVVQAETRRLNPTVPQEIIDRAYAEDEAAASAEYGAQFRRDIESFISVEVVEAATVPGRHELPPQSGVTYYGFIDFSGGRGDSHALAIAHQEQRDGATVSVLDAVREVRPPAARDTKQTCAEFAELFRRYRITTATADNYAADWPRDEMEKAQGITLKKSERIAPVLYRELLPALNSRMVELLDLPRLHAQLVSLERRVGRSGRDAIGHPRHGHDDVANAAAGALVLASARPRVRQGLLFVGPPDPEELSELDAELVRLKQELNIA